MCLDVSGTQQVLNENITPLTVISTYTPHSSGPINWGDIRLCAGLSDPLGPHLLMQGNQPYQVPPRTSSVAVAAAGVPVGGGPYLRPKPTATTALGKPWAPAPQASSFCGPFPKLICVCMNSWGGFQHIQGVSSASLQPRWTGNKGVPSHHHTCLCLVPAPASQAFLAAWTPGC